MIIDISERQSGKTTRLISYAVELLRNNRKVVIVSYNLVKSQDIKAKILQQFPLKSRFVKSQLINCSTNMVSGVYNCVDEFVHISERKLFMCPDAYYCATMSTGKNHHRIAEKLYAQFQLSRQTPLELIINQIRKEIL